jgi:hypothetical protein
MNAEESSELALGNLESRFVKLKTICGMVTPDESMRQPMPSSHKLN